MVKTPIWTLFLTSHFSCRFKMYAIFEGFTGATKCINCFIYVLNSLWSEILTFFTSNRFFQSDFFCIFPIISNSSMPFLPNIFYLFSLTTVLTWLNTIYLIIVSKTSTGNIFFKVTLLQNFVSTYSIRYFWNENPNPNSSFLICIWTRLWFGGSYNHRMSVEKWKNWLIFYSNGLL